MGTTLTGKRVQNTYDSLLKLSNNDNLTGTAQIVTDGLGNDSPIYLSTTRVGIGVSPTYEFQTNSNAKIGGNLIVGGNLTVNGTTTIVDSTVVAIGDNMIEMAKDNVANTMDIGWYGTIVESGTKFIGMKYDAGSGVTTPEFHIGLGTVEPGSTAEWTVKGKLVIGQIDSTGGTFSGQITIPETPTADGHAASKKYVDDQIGGVDKARRVTIQVKNTETISLSKGTVVHAEPTATPPSGNIVEVKKADYDTASLMPAIAILNEDLDAAGGTNDEGEAIMFGFINGIDTSSFSAGDELYVGNDGSLTNSKPLLTTQLIQKIAVVMKVDASNGSIEVFGAGRSNDVPNEVDRDLSIAGTLKVDDEIQVEADSGYGRLEVGGPDGGYIDLKTPFSDDYDLRIITNSSGSEFTGSGDFNINAGNTLTLTLDGTTQAATFAGDLTVSGGDIILGGTGRIQGIDTITDGTDAVNKNYVDNNTVDGSGTAGTLPKWTDSDTLGDSIVSSHSTNGINVRDSDSSTLATLRLGGDNASGGRIFFEYNGDSSYIDCYGGHGSTQRYRDLDIIARNLSLKGNGNLGLYIDTSGNSTFSGNVVVNNATATFNPDADSQVVIKNAGTDAVAIFAGSGDSLYLGSNDTTGLYFNTSNNATFVGQVHIDSKPNSGLAYNVLIDIGSAGDGTIGYQTVDQLAANLAVSSSSNWVKSGNNIYNSNAGTVNIGTSSVFSDRRLHITGVNTTLNATQQFGIVLNPTYPTNVTSNVFNLYTGPNLTSGTTLTNLYNLYLESNNYSGSTVSNSFGIYQAGSSDRNYFAGSVGVGNTTPHTFYPGSANLVVGTGAGDSAVTVYSNSSNTGYLLFADSTSGPSTYTAQVRYNHSTNNMEFATNNSTSAKMTLDGSGNLSLSNGAVTLNKSDGIYIDLRHNNSTRGYLGIANQIITGGSTSDLALTATTNLDFGSGGTTRRMKITSSGNVLINNTTDNTYDKLQVIGNAYIGGNATRGVRIADGGSYASVVGINQAVTAYTGLELRASGTDGQLFLSTNGKVGIGGVTAPDETLHLKLTTGDPRIKLETGGGGDPGIVFQSANNRTGEMYFQDGSTSARFSYDHAATAFKMYAHNQTVVDFYVSETLAYFSNQNVSINRTTPYVGGAPSGTDGKLNVYTSAGSSAWAQQIRHDSTTGNGLFVRAGNSSSYYTAYFAGYDEANVHFVVRGDGYVIIGGTTDYGKVTIEQGGNVSGLVVNNTTAHPPRLYLRDAGGATYSEILANNDLVFNASAVGIGTIPQYGKLQIKTASAIGYTATSFMSGTNLRLATGGTAGTNVTTGVSFGIGGSAEAYIGAVQNSSGYADVVFQTYHAGYGERVRIGSNGYFQMFSGFLAYSFGEIRSDTASFYFENAANNNYWRLKRSSNNFVIDYYNGSTTADKLMIHANGDLHADSDVIAYSTTISDERLKDDIIIIDNALEKVKKLNGVSYIWNKGSRKGKKDLGVIAQNVEKVLPEIVHEKEMELIDGETYKTVDYEKLTAVLIESVKELSDKIEALENRNCNCNCK